MSDVQQNTKTQIETGLNACMLMSLYMHAYVQQFHYLKINAHIEDAKADLQETNRGSY